MTRGSVAQRHREMNTLRLFLLLSHTAVFQIPEGMTVSDKHRLLVINADAAVLTMRRGHKTGRMLRLKYESLG